MCIAKRILWTIPNGAKVLEQVAKDPERVPSVLADVEQTIGEGGKNLGFTFWDQQKVGAREGNKGMRIDYFCVTPDLLPSSSIEVFPKIGYAPKNQPSDHAPLVLKIFDT